MNVKFNPKSPNTFASCSMDSTIRIWGLNSASPHFSLAGHTDGVNCIDFYHGSDKPYLISCSDDKTIKIWDLQTKSIIQELTAHSENVTSVCFHPKLPYIITGSEDHTIKIWDSTTYTEIETLNYGLERVWCLTPSNTTKLAIGYDKGSVVVKLGDISPIFTMDRKGKIITSNKKQLQWCQIKSNENIGDGDKIQLPSKDACISDNYPSKIEFDQKGRYLAVIGGGEYVIYQSVSYKSKTFGSAQQLVWGIDSGTYAILEKSGNIVIFKNFNKLKTFKPVLEKVEKIFGGKLIGIRSKEFISFYDWENGTFIRSIGALPKNVYWNENGDYVSLACNDQMYVLKYNDDIVKQGLKTSEIPEEGFFFKFFY